MYKLADISIFNAIDQQSLKTWTPNRGQKRDYRESKNDAIDGLSRMTRFLGSWYNFLRASDTKVANPEESKQLRRQVRNIVDTVDRGIRQYKADWYSHAFFDDPQFKTAYKEASKARARLVNLYNAIIAPESAKKGFWSNLDSIKRGDTNNLTDISAMRAKTRMFNAVHKLVEAAGAFRESYHNAKAYHSAGAAYRDMLHSGHKPPENERPSAHDVWLFKDLNKYPALRDPEKQNGIVQWAKHSTWYRKNCSPEALLTRELELRDKAAPTKTASSYPNETTAPGPSKNTVTGTGINQPSTVSSSGTHAYFDKPRPKYLSKKQMDEFYPDDFAD